MIRTSLFSKTFTALIYSTSCLSKKKHKRAEWITDTASNTSNHRHFLNPRSLCYYILLKIYYEKFHNKTTFFIVLEELNCKGTEPHVKCRHTRSINNIFSTLLPLTTVGSAASSMISYKTLLSKNTISKRLKDYE